MPTAALRVVEREARVFRRLWRGTVFSAFVTPVLFLAALGLGLGGLVDEGGGLVAGLPYLVFVTPGLLAATAMQTAAGDALWPVMVGTKWARTFHAMVATPLRPSDVYTGLMVWTALRTTLSATMFLVVGAALGGVPSAWTARRAGGGAVRLGVLRAAGRLLRHPAHRGGVPSDHAARRHATVPVLGHVLPGRPAPRLGPAGRIGVAPLARRRVGAQCHHRHVRRAQRDRARARARRRAGRGWYAGTCSWKRRLAG